ncbi:TPA: hypothetical protein N0F65_011762 [Lagenidium giganteum]|uniref:Uncharacterized protein n=1 Tax=Lagenidium giganteum TaxID=4803 RepID=A0AAV2YP30_9STRA|nr:TPA: hypothetical protein N0F65_011762 [Lagenidium giganteum]
MKFDNVQIHEVIEILRNSHPPGNTVCNEFGCSTVKEACDGDRATFKHQRIFSKVKLATTSPVVESNMLVFFREQDSEGRAVFVADSIDKDELYPYDTDKNIRMDTSFGWMFEPFIDSKGVQCVIMRRFVLSRCHMHQSRMSKDAKEVLLTKLSQVFEARLQRFVDLFQSRGLPPVL